MRRIGSLIAVSVLTIGVVVHAQEADTTKPARKPALYVVGTSHLDTQWRWSIRQTINEFIPATFADNYRLMDLYPDYVFSFEGAFRYMLLREYRPDLYARLKPLMTSGRWRPAGSWVDASDVNVPSFESLVRHALYGNGFFRREFGVTSRDVFLPDCFGFGYALPSIARHCGIESFSTQKLTWGSSVGVPFDIGVWEGVDGSSLVAALNPGEYVSRIESDLSRDTTWLQAAEKQEKESGLPAAYRYFGTGDTGGAPDSASVAWLAKSQHSDGPLTVKSIGSDDLIEIAAQTRRADLPRYKGELLMTRHGVGCYTSQATMKRWNRQNELLADATERAAVTAALLGAAAYPREELQDLWVRFLWHQFHDDLTGTSIPEAYEFSWNDEILCQNRFAAMLKHSIALISPALDTRGQGIPLIVYNPLAFPREDIVTATLTRPSGWLDHALVFGPDGAEVPSQVTRRAGDSLTVAFVAKVPSVGYAVFDIRPSATPCTIQTDLRVSTSTLENHTYRVQVSAAGDVTSIFDKQEGRELLAGPIQLQLLADNPNLWPAWEIDYDDIMAPPPATVGGRAEIEIVEDGPARVALRITRRIDNSVFRTVLSLATGAAGDRVAFDESIDWSERATLLKASFPFTSANEHVTYDLGLGTIQRGLNHANLYEVPGHQWADMTSPDGAYGVAVLNDCRYGWDHPDSATLRLSLIHTPGVAESWSWVDDQKSQDKGHHRLSYAIAGHRGDWRDGNMVRKAAEFNQSLLTFQTVPHAGTLGKAHSLLTIEQQNADGQWTAIDPQGGVFVNALKQAEDSDEIIIRLRETAGRSTAAVRVRFAYPVVAAREVNGAEEPVGPAVVEGGALVTSLGPYRPRAFAVTLESLSATPPDRAHCLPLTLPLNLDGISTDEDRTDGDLHGGRTLPGELLPDSLIWLDVPFVFGPKSAGVANVARCEGQVLTLPSGDFDRLSLLVTAVGGPARAQFTVGNRDTTLWIQDYAEPIAQWNNRLVAGNLVDEPELIAPEYINRAPVAWYGTHRHSEAGENEAYQFTYLYLVNLDLPDGATSVTLPDNSRVRVLAATLVPETGDPIRPAQNLYDVGHATLTRIASERRSFVDSLVISLSSPNPGAVIRYTLDNSPPTEASPLYAGPVTIDETATIKARAFLAGADDAYVAAATYHHLTMREAVTADDLRPGLWCTYYEGSWDRLPGFDTLKARKTIVADSVGIPELARDEDYGLVLIGYVKVPHDGLYDFHLASDDGSDLNVSDTLVVDNDGLHGMGEIIGGIGLKAGLHPILIRMFQKKGGEGLTLHVDGPGIPKQPVPAEWLYRDAKKPKRR